MECLLAWVKCCYIPYAILSINPIKKQRKCQEPTQTCAYFGSSPDERQRCPGKGKLTTFQGLVWVLIPVKKKKICVCGLWLEEPSGYFSLAKRNASGGKVPNTGSLQPPRQASHRIAFLFFFPFSFPQENPSTFKLSRDKKIIDALEPPAAPVRAALNPAPGCGGSAVQGGVTEKGGKKILQFSA